MLDEEGDCIGFPVADEIDLEKAQKYQDMRLETEAREDKFHSIQDQGDRHPFSLDLFEREGVLVQQDYFEDQVEWRQADNRDTSIGWAPVHSPWSLRS